MLYVVPTPVGNLEDMTFRAVRVLKEADFILAEDTRTSSVLLQHYDIHGELLSHHKFNEHETVQQVVRRLEGGETAALISDAGTPGISDPSKDSCHRRRDGRHGWKHSKTSLAALSSTSHPDGWSRPSSSSVKSLAKSDK